MLEKLRTDEAKELNTAYCFSSCLHLTVCCVYFCMCDSCQLCMFIAQSVNNVEVEAYVTTAYFPLSDVPTPFPMMD